MANVKFIAVSRGLRGIVDYVTNREKTVEQLISSVSRSRPCWILILSTSCGWMIRMSATV